MTSKIDNVTSRIDRLFGSRTRVALLSKLLMNVDRSFHIRELSRNLGISYSVVYKEVRNLSLLGILNEEKRGKITLVSANRRLPFFRELKGLVMKTAGLVDLLRTALGEVGGITFALVYGSFASGEESESSDVDVLLVGDVSEEKVLRAVRQVEEKTGREINYIVWRENTFRKNVKAKHHLLEEIANGPVMMIAGEENEFRRAVERQGRKEN